MAVAEWEQPLQMVVAFEQAEYPDMEVTIMGGLSGDYTWVVARKRGEVAQRTWKISNTFLATVTPPVLADEFHKFMKGIAGTTITDKVGIPDDSWTDEWIKKNVKR